MLIDYISLSDTSKIYIYPSNRKFYDKELSVISKELEDFLMDFKEVNSFFEIKYNRFILIFVSENTPLSIDQNNNLVSFIITLENKYKIVLLDKVNVCFKQGKYVQIKEVSDFKKLIKNKGVSKKTIVFNNLINTKSEFECCWEIPANESGIAHFFK